MQMRSWAVWCLTVIGLCALANPAWAAPKKKKKAKADETAEPADVKEPAAAVSDDPKDIDALMDDSTKNKPAPVKKQAVAEPSSDPEKPLCDVAAGECASCLTNDDCPSDTPNCIEQTCSRCNQLLGQCGDAACNLATGICLPQSQIWCLVPGQTHPPEHQSRQYRPIAGLPFCNS